MRTPVGLIAGVLGFWGWQTGLLYLAILMGVVLEGARWVKVNWEFSEVDLQRIWTLCTLLFLGATVVSFVSNDGAGGLMGLLQGGGMNRTEALNATTRSVLVLLQWMPLIFFPMMAAQAYGQNKAFDARIFSWILRQRHARNPDLTPPPSLNVSYPYVVICLASASTASLHREWFYVGLAVTVGWALWRARSPRHALAVWGVVFLAAGLLGFGGQLGLRQLQRLLQHLDASWLARGTELVDRSGTLTDLGTVGRLKLSGRIVLRVQPETFPVPELLREVSYNEFESPSRWYSANKPMAELTAEELTAWTLLAGKETPHSVKISRRMGTRGRGILAVPNGTARLEDLGAYRMRTNTMGVLKVVEGPGVIGYRARFGPGQSMDGPPEAADLFIPVEESNAVARVALEMDLGRHSQAAVMPAIRKHFQDRFEYSIFLDRAPPAGTTPLGHFLLNRRSGHCEYFAAASVFLLRQAGIPARYAVGYSVQEKKGDGYVVRGRHAHAWSLAFINGQWKDFDATPPDWDAIESEKAGLWEPVTDLFSDLWFAFSEWRWSDPGIRKYLPWLLVPPIGVVMFRLIVRRQWRRLRREEAKEVESAQWPGSDSEFYRVERALLEEGLERRPGEGVRSWVGRVGEADRKGGADLERLAALHYRYRFRPAGLEPAEREGLRQGAEEWLEGRSKGAG